MCVFCDIANKKLETNIVYEDEMVMAFLDCDPINEGHVLLIPKKHYLDVDEIPEENLSHLMIVSQKIVKAIKNIYHPNGYSIMQNGGEFNDVGHYHLHIFPRYENDGFGWTFSDEVYNTTKEVADRIRQKLIKAYSAEGESLVFNEKREINGL